MLHCGPADVKTANFRIVLNGTIKVCQCIGVLPPLILLQTEVTVDHSQSCLNAPVSREKVPGTARNPNVQNDIPSIDRSNLCARRG